MFHCKPLFVPTAHASVVVPGREVRYLDEVLLDWHVESHFSNIHGAASGEVLVPGNVAFPDFGSPYQHGTPGA